METEVLEDKGRVLQGLIGKDLADSIHLAFKHLLIWSLLNPAERILELYSHIFFQTEVMKTMSQCVIKFAAYRETSKATENHI